MSEHSIQLTIGKTMSNQPKTIDCLDVPQIFDVVEDEYLFDSLIEQLNRSADQGFENDPSFEIVENPHWLVQL